MCKCVPALAGHLCNWHLNPHLSCYQLSLHGLGKLAASLLNTFRAQPSRAGLIPRKITLCQSLSSMSLLQMEYEDLLPYSDFALRLPQHMIYRLPVILEELLQAQRDKVPGQGLGIRALELGLRPRTRLPMGHLSTARQIRSPGQACQHTLAPH